MAPLLHRLWRPRNWRRTGCVCPSRTHPQSQVVEDPPPHDLTGHPPRSHRAPHPQRPALQTSAPPTTTTPPSLPQTRTKHQIHHRSTGSQRTAALTLMEEQQQNQSHRPQVHVTLVLHLSDKDAIIYGIMEMFNSVMTRLTVSSYWNISWLCLSTSDSVFEHEGAVTAPVVAQPAEEGENPESEANPAESAGTELPTQTDSGTGQSSWSCFVFTSRTSSLLCLLSRLFS